MSSSPTPTHPVVKGIGFIFGGTLVGVVSQALINLFTGVPPTVGTILLVSGIGGGFLGGAKELLSYFLT